MGDIGPVRRRKIEILPTTDPVVPAPSEPRRRPAPDPVHRPAPAKVPA